MHETSDVPAAAIRAREMYASGSSNAAIFEETGLRGYTLYRWLDGGPKLNGKRLLEPLTRQKIATRGKTRDAEYENLVAEIVSTARTGVGQIRTRMDASGMKSIEENQDAAAALAVYARVATELRARKNAAEAEGKSVRKPSKKVNDDPVPRNIDELRRQLADKIDRLRAGAATRIHRKP